MLARAQRPISVTGLNDDEDEDEESENSEGAKRILARLGVAMARYTFPNLLFSLLDSRFLQQATTNT